jgi:hypothetical protein
MKRKFHVRFGGGPSEQYPKPGNSPAAYPTRRKPSVTGWTWASPAQIEASTFPGSGRRAPLGPLASWRPLSLGSARGLTHVGPLQ